MIARIFRDRSPQWISTGKNPSRLLSAECSNEGVVTSATFVIPQPHSQPELQLPAPLLAPKKFKTTPYQYHEEVTVEVQSLSSEGNGVAVDPQHPDRTISVPKVWPGEVVTVRIFRNNTDSEQDYNCTTVPLYYCTTVLLYCTAPLLHHCVICSAESRCNIR